MNDPLFDVLRPTGEPASPEVREAIFRRTLPHLRRPKRPVVAVLLLVGAVAAALLVMAVPPARPKAALPREAVKIERKATEDPSLYRVAADRYLEEGRQEEAVRCYGNALDAASGGELDIEPGDSYLLMVIKDARKRERAE